MTPHDLRILRRRLGLTQTAAARLCGVAFRTWQSWELHERPIGEPERRLIGLLEVPEARAWLAAQDRPPAP